MSSKIGMRSRLKYVVDALENELGEAIFINEIAEESGLSRATISTYMKPYAVMERIDINKLHAIAQAVEKIARDRGVKNFRVFPEDLIEFVGWTSSNKIEGLLAPGA